MASREGSPNSKRLDAARKALALGDVTTAEIITREYLDEQNNSVEGLRLRLDVLSRLKDFENAVGLVGRLIELTGESRDLFFEGAYYAELGGNYELALKGYEKVLQLEPVDIQALLGMGRSLLNSTGVHGADVFFARVLELEPDNQEAAEYLALAYEKDSNLQRGIPFCEEYLQKYPGSWLLQVVLGNLWGDGGKSAKGLIYVSKAIELAPAESKPLVAAATLLTNMRRPFEAMDFLERASKLSPGDLNIDLEKARLYRGIGRSEESIQILEKVFRYVPNLVRARSNYLYYLHDVNGVSRERLYTESVRYDQDICAQIPALEGDFVNDKDTGRKLVLGFLSSDLREHSVAYFLLPLLERLDRSAFSIVLFSSNPRDDAYTDKFRSLATEYIDVGGLLDYDLAKLMREKHIDVLLELGGHTAGSRLNVCAYRAAPVQIDWLGYPDTTGLSSVDYRLVDAITDPEGEADNFASEKLIRMPEGFLCYQPPETAPEVAALPVDKNGYITFGSFSNMAKINGDMIALWSRLLLDNPDSRLLLKNKALGEERGKTEMHLRFQQFGVEPERIILHGSTESTRGHLSLYAQVDIALDTFPYNGTTTIFEALYMGVPVVGLCGLTHASRVGASILSRVGLKQLVAGSAQEYLLIASALARQVEDLRQLRRGMRSRLVESGMLDSSRFAQDFSTVMRRLWLEWVEKDAAGN